jgi:LPS-assembly protein
LKTLLIELVRRVYLIFMMRTALALQFFVGVGVCLGVQLGASAQQALAGDALILRASPMLIEKPSPESLREAPAFVSGQSMTGQTDVRLVIEGSAQLRRGPVAVRAQRLDFEETSQKLKGDGAVRVSRMGNVFSGQELSLRMDTFEGFFIRPQYRFLGGGQGQAQRFDFQGQQRMTAQGVSYTTCERDNEESWKPPWEFTADQMDFDFEAERKTCACAFMTPPSWPGPVRSVSRSVTSASRAYCPPPMRWTRSVA